MNIVEVFEKFITVYQENQLPEFISILNIAIPIVLSIVVIIQNYYINKRNEKLQIKIAEDNDRIQNDLATRNEKLQKNIYNNEIKIKIYDIVLNAYTAFINAYSELPQNESAFNLLIDNGKQNADIIVKIIETKDKVNLEYNKLKLLLKDDTEIIDIITNLKGKYEYIVNEISFGAAINKTIDRKNVYKEINNYRELLKYENYDKYFEKYLSFKEM